MAVQKRKKTSKLELTEFKLNALLQITKAINNNVSTQQIIAIYRSVLKDQLKIGKLILFSYYDGWNCILKYGVKGLEKKINVNRDLANIIEIKTLESSNLQDVSLDVIVPVFHKDKPLAYVLIGDINENEIQISPTIKHLNFIQTLTNIIAVAIENKRLTREGLRQERVKKELEMASEMQNMLFPETLPNNDKIEVSAYYQPHNEVGGDYYDYIQLNEDESLFCIADVSGKGISAALLMANLQAHLHALYQQYLTLEVVIKQLNEKVLKSAKGEKFITLFMAEYNSKTRKLKYINAGHNPPMVWHNGRTEELTTGCPGLGMLTELPFINKGTMTMPPDSLIVCYTDGVVELENEKDEEYGTEMLEEAIQQYSRNSINELNLNIIKSLNTHKEGRPFLDDVALISCRFF
ncbi:MAG: PP2C family protein-serine/threonine phosphatase [Flavobacteriales bacterium]|nr:PP2C family protein-serine/threonine phosphatase [Flavobacteriales bacterium]